MDGNGRWAKNRNLPRTAGHKEGLSAAKRIGISASMLGIKYLTLYTFSTENWKRTQEEVGFLFNLIKIYLRNEFELYKKNNIRLLHLGDLTTLPPDIQQEITHAMDDTKDFTGLTIVLAINYGGKDEIIRNIKKINPSHLDNINEHDFSSLFEPQLPPVDLIIRTGGEKRLSNFLLWQGAYAELDFSDILWPDYTEDDFKNALLNYQKRTRRFGGL
ncbi:MAG: polyprenyl diphosphate synthase [Treponemataceae bacterium]